ncbi:MerR family transcriptional regulator [Leeuwenhoekiella sp. MAR_2009_132]|uniref:MerR family transcriptional regulator n=1 Tax=Leeuwenhoekiella sp. MAR_2009_132 TaxID=1392489 RepID=UPI00048E698B|nr:MerR family transcriptional regulator [Leeuwenhoekiella sp. MAR_2009_132]
MNAVKTSFSIKDLENLSGIKAHTIRIWERRYNLLEPDRSETNIRNYTLPDLQKLLNVVYLLDHDYKISKIAKNSSAEIASIVASIVENSKLGSNSNARNSFKIAMMNFDQKLFTKTYTDLLEHHSFREIFFQIFIPFLEEIGLLWQAGVVNPAHEHFISSLIKQKILLLIEHHDINEATTADKTFILFLPENEIHDLGLMYLNYEIVSHGYKSIYLGQSIPNESLKYLANNQTNANFVSYLTVKPSDISVTQFAHDFYKDIQNNEVSLFLLGRLVQNEETTNLPPNVQLIKTVEAFRALL